MRAISTFSEIREVDEFIKHLIKAIETRDMPIIELSRQSGVARPYIYRVLSGEQTPSLDVAIRLASALGLSINLEKIA